MVRYYCTLKLFLFQVNISYAIIRVTQALYPRDWLGIPIALFHDFSQTVPLITFTLSLFTASFGMTKFLLRGPLSILPHDAHFRGVLSIPFFATLGLNTMFAFRLFALEAIFFSSYRKISADDTNLETIGKPENMETYGTI